MLNRIYFAETGRKTIGSALYPYMLSPLCQSYYRRLLLKILAGGEKNGESNTTRRRPAFIQSRSVT